MNIELIEELARLRAAFKLLKVIISEAEEQSRFANGEPYRELDVNRDAIKYVFLVAGDSDHEVIIDSETEGSDVCTTQDE